MVVEDTTVVWKEEVEEVGVMVVGRRVDVMVVTRVVMEAMVTATKKTRRNI